MSPTSSFDSSLCPAAVMEDLSSEKVGEFLATARAVRGFPLPASTCASDVLQELRLIRDNRPTNAAVLLFGRKPQSFIPSSQLLCAQYDNDTISAKQLCHGTLFELIQQATYFVLTRITTAPSVYEIPVEALREAIVNAVAHRDYQIPANIQVSVHADRIEISNPAFPGTNPNLLSQPLPPNPLLAEPLWLAAYRATKGSGTTDIISRCKEAGLPAPRFAMQDSFITTLYRKPNPLEQPKPETPPIQQLIPLLRLLDKEGPLGTAAIAQRLHKDRSNLHKQLLQPALAAGLIELTIPDTPNSRKQQYRLTAKGKETLEGQA